MSGPRGIGVVQLAGWTPTARAAGGARRTPGPCRGRARGAQPTPGGAGGGPGSWGARVRGRQGPCVQVVGSSPEAARAGRGAEEQKGWRSRPSRPRGQTCLSVTSPRWKSPARGCFSGGGHGGSAGLRGPALPFPTWPRWCCRRQKPVAGWPRSDPDHQPCWGVPGTAPPACAQGSPCSARCPVPPAEVTRPGQRLVVADVDGSRSWGWHLVPWAGPGAWGCPGWLRCRAAVGEGREHRVGPRQHAAGLSQVLRGGALPES